MIIFIIALVILVVLFVTASAAFCIATLYNVTHPIHRCKINLHTFITKKRIYLIAGMGARWIVEVATPSSEHTIPVPEGEKFSCIIVKGQPYSNIMRLPNDDVKYIQRKLGEHLGEYYQWIQVTEIWNVKERS